MINVFDETLNFFIGFIKDKGGFVDKVLHNLLMGIFVLFFENDTDIIGRNFCWHKLFFNLIYTLSIFDSVKTINRVKMQKLTKIRINK